MKDPESSTVFAGVDGRTDTELPEWYRRKKTVDEPVSFAEAIRDLPQAVETTVAYQNPYTDEWVETERFNALVEPNRARSQAREGDAQTDPLFHIPTDSYAIINPVDIYGPLEEVLREETIDETPLGDVMFSEIRRYRGGGEVHMDIMFGGLEVRLPGRSDPRTSIDTDLAGRIGAGPLVGTTDVWSGTGSDTETRPLVDVDLCLNGRWRTVTASITDRSEMTYPVLLGRDVLQAYTLDISQTVEEEDMSSNRSAGAYRSHQPPPERSNTYDPLGPVQLSISNGTKDTDRPRS